MKTGPFARLTTAAAILGAGLALLSGCHPGGGNQQKASHDQPAVKAEVMTVQTKTAPIYAQVPGRVVASQEVQVASRLSGFIRIIKVHEGEEVKQGQLLLSLDSSDLKGRIDQARARLSQAGAALNNAESVYKRFKPLWKAGAITPQKFDNIRSERDQAQAEVVSARAALATARSRLQYADVRAPIDGVVTEKLADAGDLATPGKPLLVLQNSAHRQVRFDVDDATYGKLQLGGKVSISTPGGYVSATVERLVPSSDPVTHTHLVKAALPGGLKLSPGTFVNVRIDVGTQQAIVVPATAVIQRAGITGAFIVDSQGVAHYRMIRPGPRHNGALEVTAGLHQGDRVVVMPDERVNNGVRIEVAPVAGNGGGQ